MLRFGFAITLNKKIDFTIANLSEKWIDIVEQESNSKLETLIRIYVCITSLIHVSKEELIQELENCPGTNETSGTIVYTWLTVFVSQMYPKFQCVKG